MAERIHATAIAAGGDVVILRGRSGSGKSDLALRCLALPCGPLLPDPFVLVGDDQVHLTARDGLLLASGAPELAGLIEVRGVGIVRLTDTTSGVVRLVVDLVDGGTVERLPDPASTVLDGIEVPVTRLAPLEASAPLKVALALARACRDGK